MISSDLNAAYDTVGKKMFGGSKALDMPNILIRETWKIWRGEKRGGAERREMLRLCKSHLMGVVT